MITVMGIDPSIRSTGVCIIRINLETRHYAILHTSTIPTSKDPDMDIISDVVTRSSYIIRNLQDLIITHNVSRLAIEGLSFGSAGQATRNLAMLFGSILHTLNLPFITVPPSTLKKFATGNGKATKQQMLDEIAKTNMPLYQQFADIKVSKGQSDVVDAYWLARYNMEQLL